ncbi:hypothetical protein ACQ4PT_005932 [Festuca glaucescens]
MVPATATPSERFSGEDIPGDHGELLTGAMVRSSQRGAGHQLGMPDNGARDHVAGVYWELVPLPPDPGETPIKPGHHGKVQHRHKFPFPLLPYATLSMENQGEKSMEQRGSSNAVKTQVSITTGSKSKQGAAGPSWRREGKQAMEDERTDEERTPIIVDLGKARGTSRARLVAVGVFLSVISITSKQLVSYMKNVWKLRGTVESLQLADRRFVLDFSLEGDFEHVTCGGPWRYQEDAVLIRKLKEGEDPNLVRFDSMPIWVQFTRIPFYLLSKQLARELGTKLGKCIRIDNDERGDICDKIIRVRVRIPIARALQRWITLEDEFSDEEVVVTVLYERLPTFCLCCGVIGHKEEACELPAILKKRRYSRALGVPATHVEGIRKWYLPATAGEVGRALQMDMPWRNVAALGARRDPATRVLAIVANVVNAVENLSVQDKDAGADQEEEEAHDSNKNTIATTPATPTPAASVESKTDASTNKSAINTTSTGINDNTKAEIAIPALRTWKRVIRDDQKAVNNSNEVPAKEAELFHDHDVQVIQSLRIPPHVQEDRVTWHYESNGIFSFKSAYRLALKLKHQYRGDESSSTNTNGDRALWNCIWKANVPPKVRIFAWRLANDTLATRNNKLKRKLEFTDRCTICGTPCEDGHHAVIRCPKAAGLRHAMRAHWKLPSEGSLTHSGKDWLLLLLNQVDEKIKARILLLLWRAWHLRNNIVHDDGKETVENSVSFLLSYNNTIKTMEASGKAPMLRKNGPVVVSGTQERPRNWTPLPQGWVKLNTDASFLSAEGASGAGAVLRDHQGKVLLAACSPILRCIHAMDAEVKAVLCGINLLRGLGHSRVILEADNATVVAALRSKELDRSRSWATYDQAKRWLGDLEDYRVIHKSRESNKVADALAKMARSAGSCLWFDLLWDLVTQDLVPVVASLI